MAGLLVLSTGFFFSQWPEVSYDPAAALSVPEEPPVIQGAGSGPPDDADEGSGAGSGTKPQDGGEAQENEPGSDEGSSGAGSDPKVVAEPLQESGSEGSSGSGSHHGAGSAPVSAPPVKKTAPVVLTDPAKVAVRTPVATPPVASAPKDIKAPRPAKTPKVKTQAAPVVATTTRSLKSPAESSKRRVRRPRAIKQVAPVDESNSSVCPPELNWFSAPLVVRVRDGKYSIESSEPVVLTSSSDRVVVPGALQHSPEPAPSFATLDPSVSSRQAFVTTLARMTERREGRMAQAMKTRTVLPSQGGDLVRFPALGKIIAHLRDLVPANARIEAAAVPAMGVAGGSQSMSLSSPDTSAQAADKALVAEPSAHVTGGNDASVAPIAAHAEDKTSTNALSSWQ